MFGEPVRGSLMLPHEKDGIMVITCKHCDEEKEAETNFHKHSIYKERYVRTCKECMRTKVRKKYDRKLMMADNLADKERYNFKKIAPQSLLKKFEKDFNKEKVQKIVACLMEEPRIEMKELAERVGISKTRLLEYCNSNNFIKAFRRMATQKVSTLIPLAFAGLKGSLISQNEKVKYDASVKVLENERIMGPNQIDITVSDMRSRSTEELQKIIQQAKQIPGQTIDAELVD